jgi:AmpE protein
MSATLIAVIVVLIAGHAVQSLAALRRFDWLVEWRRYVGGQSEAEGTLNGRVGLLLVIGLPVLLIGLLQLALRQSLWGVPWFVFAVLLLFYCWGPRDLDLDVESIVDAPDAEHKRDAAASLLSATSSPSSVAAPASDGSGLNGHALVEAVFNGALRRWFGPLLWFLLLGPAGAFAYRIIALLAIDPAHADAPTAQREDARWLLSLLDWPVAQLMTFALALAANFDAVFGAWRDWHAGGVRLDIGFLGAAARASVDIEIADDDTDLPDGSTLAATPALLELRDAMSLVWRMLLLWLAVIAIFVIAHFL